MSVASRWMKGIDAVVGPILCWLFSQTQETIETRTLATIPGPILVIRPGGIGDAVMLLPLLVVLRARFPEREVDIFCERRNAALLRLARPDMNIVVYDETPLRALWTLCRRHYAAVLDTEQFHHASGVMAALTRAPLRVGYKINTHRRGIYTHGVSYDLDGPEDEQFVRLLSAACGEPIGADSRWGLLREAVEKRVFFSASDGLGERPYFVIHVGGSIACKRCSTETLATACRAIAESEDLDVVLVGSGATDCEQAREMERLLVGIRCFNYSGKLNLEETASVCLKAMVLVGPDSGIAHCAVAVGTPVVVIFGPSDARKWGPPADAGASISVQLPCSPCSIFGYTKPCRRPECMMRITSEAIERAVLAVLAKAKRMREKV